jgi:hypothetical protein
MTRRIKAVFFGGSFFCYLLSAYMHSWPVPGITWCTLPPASAFADLDDTLVLTNHIDKRAYERVRELARQQAPGLDEQQLIADWKALFGAQPWDPDHRVSLPCEAGDSSCSCSA